MRKHNKRFAQRWGREKGDRSNFPQHLTHGYVNNKSAQFLTNDMLQSLLSRAGI